MPIATTTTISSSNSHHCHPHYHRQQPFAGAVAPGQLVVVVRMVDDHWYLVPGCFFSGDAAAHSNSNVYSRCPPPPQPEAATTTTTTTTSSDKLLLVLVLSWWWRSLVPSTCYLVCGGIPIYVCMLAFPRTAPG